MTADKVPAAELARREALAREAIAGDPTLGGLLEKPAWKCGDPNCAQSRGWHARRASYLRETIGPEAEGEFEQDHPDPEQGE